MSLEQPSTKAELIQAAKINLGEPAIKVNITPEQENLRFREALNLFMMYHADSTEQVYVAQQITPTDLTNGYFTTSDEIIRVTSILDKMTALNPVFGNDQSIGYPTLIGAIGGYGNNSVHSAGSPLMTIFSIKSFLENFKDIVYAPTNFRWNPVTKRLYIDSDLRKRFVAGQYICYKAHTSLEEFNDGNSALYGNYWLVRYLTELYRLQWGTNFNKFKNMKLPGDIEIDSAGMIAEAKENIRELKEELMSSYAEWPSVIIR